MPNLFSKRAQRKEVVDGFRLWVLILNKVAEVAIYILGKSVAVVMADGNIQKIYFLDPASCFSWNITNGVSSEAGGVVKGKKRER